MNNPPKIKERMLSYLEINKITKQKFCEITGISYGNITGKALKSEFGGEQIAEILLKFEKLNPDWLLLGKGDMLRISEEEIAAPPVDSERLLKEILADKDRQLAEANQLIGTLRAQLMGKQH